MSGIGPAAAVLGGAAWALPWLSALVGADRPLFWHEAHAIAGLGWAVAFLAHAGRWSSAAGVMALRVAAVAAGAFALTNAGEALTGNEVFVVPYGIALLAMSAAALVAGVQGLRDLVLPRPAAYVRVAVAMFPVALLFGVAGMAAGYAALLAYGAAWLWFAAVGSRTLVGAAA